MGKYDEEEIRAIEKLIKATKDTVMLRKYQVVYLHMKGYTNVQISEITTLHEKTVGVYVNAYKLSGADALVPKKPSGRPSFLSEEQEAWLYKTIKENTPEEVGFEGIRNWTAKIACLWVLKEFGVQYSVNGMLDLFHRINLSYTRPTYVLAKADPEKQEQFRDDFEVVKKN